MVGDLTSQVTIKRVSAVSSTKNSAKKIVCISPTPILSRTFFSAARNFVIIFDVLSCQSIPATVTSWLVKVAS